MATKRAPIEMALQEKQPWAKSSIEQGYDPRLFPPGIEPRPNTPKAKGRQSLFDRVESLEPIKGITKRLDVRLLSLTEAARRLGIKRGDNIEYLVDTKQLKLTYVGNR